MGKVIEVDFKKRRKTVSVEEGDIGTEIKWTTINTGFVSVFRDDDEIYRMHFNSKEGVMQSVTGANIWVPLALRTLARFWDSKDGLFGGFACHDYGEFGLLLEFGFVERHGLLWRDADEQWPVELVAELKEIEAIAKGER
jgi:hypothetical protein